MTSCWPVQQRHHLDKGSLRRSGTNASTRVHLTDGSVILFERGFTIAGDSLIGSGERFGLTRFSEGNMRWAVDFDSVTGMEYFVKNTPSERGFGEVFIAATTYVPAGALLLKVVFGSCPTVYSKSGHERHLEAECFSHSISSMFERADMDRLEVRDTSSPHFSLELRNEALETHYINELKLAYHDHPTGTEVYSISDDEVLQINAPFSSLNVHNSEGLDVTHTLTYRDNFAYTVDSATTHRMLYARERDHLDVRVKVPKGQEELSLVLRGRNSLQNTVLFYELMMRDQGVHVLDWSEKISSNLWTAWRIHRWYQANSGVIVSVKDGDDFEEEGRIRDTGPIAWKTSALKVDLPDHDGEVTVRLSFIPDSWNIDWVGFDTVANEPIEPQFVRASTITRHQNKSFLDDSATLADDDGEYLTTMPGESLDLDFTVPPLASSERTYFVRAKGYYVEWVRPEWVRHTEEIRLFEPSEPEAIRARLAELWLKRKNSFEQEFFEFKVPINAEHHD